MGSTHSLGPALVTACADADPVTLLVLGWLAAKRSQNTRTAYARDIGITPQRRASLAPSWLAWCQEQGVHPVTGVTGLHVAVYARQLDAYLATRADLTSVPVLFATRTGGRLFAADVWQAVRPPRHPGRPASRPGQPSRTAHDAAFIRGSVPRCRQVAPRSPVRHGLRRPTNHPAVRPGPAHPAHSPGPASAAAPGAASAAGAADSASASAPSLDPRFRTMAARQASLPRPAAACRRAYPAALSRAGGRGRRDRHSYRSG